ncbi:MAG: magnesium transporter [Saprospiraceae bacterium]|nr:magnesium transporter [Saprospiraceae bacterium]
MIRTGELNQQHPSDIAEILEEMNEHERLLAFLLLGKQVKAEVFSYISPGIQQDLIKELGSTQIAEVLENMAPDDRTEILENIPDTMIKESINLLSDKEKDIALTLLGYPEKCVARLMTPYYVQAKKDWTVDKTLEHIKRYGRKAETLNFVYVIDDQQRLVSDIRIGRLLMADDHQTLEALMDHGTISLKSTMSREDAIDYFDKYDRAALPVVTEDGVLVGIVTVDDILDEIEKRDTEDFLKFGGIETMDLSYTETSMFALFKKRAPWLIILLIGEMFTATVMSHYEHAIAQAVVLALFVPLIISSGGNTGSQAATLIVRAMALKELEVRDWFYVIKKELMTGLLLGLVLGCIGFLRIYLWQELDLFDFGEFYLYIAAAVGISLVGVVIWGTLVGSLVPLILKSFRLDPATSSAPFVATMVDITGLIIYFSIATLLLTGRLL